MKTLKLILLIILILISSMPAYGFCPPGGGSPEFNTISGTVTENEGIPLAKVKVCVKDTDMFYITDERGFFILSNVNKENVSLTFEYKNYSAANSSLETSTLKLGNIGMKKVVFAEDITFSNATAEAKKIYIKNSYDLLGMSPTELAVFQFTDSSLEDQVKAFLGVRDN